MSLALGFIALFLWSMTGSVISWVNPSTVTPALTMTLPSGNVVGSPK